MVNPRRWQSRSISRVLSLSSLKGGNHLSRISVTTDLNRPTRESSEAGHFSSSIWSFSGWGLPSYHCRQWYWWALTSPFHPYLR